MDGTALSLPIHVEGEAIESYKRQIILGCDMAFIESIFYIERQWCHQGTHLEVGVRLGTIHR